MLSIQILSYIRKIFHTIIHHNFTKSVSNKISDQISAKKYFIVDIIIGGTIDTDTSIMDITTTNHYSSVINGIGSPSIPYIQINAWST